MLTDRYDPVDLFALVPQLSLGMKPELVQLDGLLEDDALFQHVKADLAKRYPETLVRGRHSTPVEVILRMLVVKRLYGLSYQELEYFVSDSLVLRQFCRLGLHPAPDDTTLIRWANQITPATIERLHERVVALAREQKVTRGRKLRVDTTLVETNIHHPTDGSLLADGVRVLSRLLRRAKEQVGEAAGVSDRTFTSHGSSARKWLRVIYGLARRVRAARKDPGAPKRRREKEGNKTASASSVSSSSSAVGETPAEKKRKQAEEGMKAAYEHLIAVTRQSVAQAQRVSALLKEEADSAAKKLREEIEAFVPRVERVIRQAQQRVIEGVAVPASEKLVSLFEPHTQIVQRGKPSRAVEFGRKIRLDEVEGGIISGYAVLPEPGSDAPYLKESLANHQARFGKAPRLLTADRGFWSPENERRAQQAGVKRVVIPYAGKAPPERMKEEKERGFRRGYRFRAGVEGRISVLKRRFGLDCCLDHGEEGLARWVGWGVVTANLVQIARATAAR
jgi:IS5 family transposase